MEHVEGALRLGKGAILWVFPFTYSDLVTKQSLCESGFRVTHLSAVTHGYSGTRLGVAVLNRVRTRIEDRYIKERILLSEQGSSVSALRLLRGRLKENGVVSVTATHSGLRVFDLPFLHGTLKLANGAPSLAISTGASLVPVFTVRDAKGGFTTRVCAPLVPDTSLSRHAAEEQLARHYVDLSKPFVSAHADLWPGWFGRARWIAPAAKNAEPTVSAT
jgi:lauroyl/myristoyl acyltransferase